MMYHPTLELIPTLLVSRPPMVVVVLPLTRDLHSHWEMQIKWAS